MNDDIFIVDDDPLLRDALSLAFSRAGYHIVAFSDGDTFLTAARRQAPACVLLDVRMPGRSGIEVLKALNAEQCGTLVFVMSGHGDIPTAVDAIRNGALDFIEKPLDAYSVVERVRNALKAAARLAENPISAASALKFPGRDLLTKRESDVLAEIAAGASNKKAGHRLGISFRTVEVHRARIMEKLGARNLPELMRIVLGGERR